MSVHVRKWSSRFYLVFHEGSSVILYSCSVQHTCAASVSETVGGVAGSCVVGALGDLSTQVPFQENTCTS